MQRTVVLASNNAGKLAEFSSLLAPLGLELRKQSELGISEAEEPYATFVENALAKVKALQGVYFNWNQKDFPEKDFGTQNELGFIAQEVEQIVPEIVVKEQSKEEYRSVKYDKLVALLVEAMKEQQKQIEQLQIKVKQLSKKRKK